MLVKVLKDNIDIKRLERHITELAGYDISEKRILENLMNFLDLLGKENLYG